MKDVVYTRPAHLEQASQWLDQHPDARILAGGQSLLAAMKLGMASPSHLVDLQSIAGLRSICHEPAIDKVARPASLWIGAMATHAQVADSELVRHHLPMLAELAGGIADQQVRNLGTLGGSLANNDPSACWPTAVLALGACVLTQRRTVTADEFFMGLFTTTLQPGEIILGVRFPLVQAGGYRKFEQPASRFALVGVAVARGLPNQPVRVAITGLGRGVVRWPQAEQALSAQLSVSAVQALVFPADQVSTDVHASAAYRAHLAGVLCRQVVARITGESLPAFQRPKVDPSAALSSSEPSAPPGSPSPSSQTPQASLPPPVWPATWQGGAGQLLAGRANIALPIAQVWHALLDPAVLQQCIPGCQSLQATQAQVFEAIVKVGIGPLSARFQTGVRLHDLQAPATLVTTGTPAADPAEGASCQITFSGQAGVLGQGTGLACVVLRPHAQGTVLDWQARVQAGGRIAQMGNRLIEATASRLSEEFFARFSAVAGAPADAHGAGLGSGLGSGRGPASLQSLPGASPALLLWRRWWLALQRLWRR